MMENRNLSSLAWNWTECVCDVVGLCGVSEMKRFNVVKCCQVHGTIRGGGGEAEIR